MLNSTHNVINFVLLVFIIFSISYLIYPVAKSKGSVQTKPSLSSLQFKFSFYADKKRPCRGAHILVSQIARETAIWL